METAIAIMLVLVLVWAWVVFDHVRWSRAAEAESVERAAVERDDRISRLERELLHTPPSEWVAEAERKVERESGIDARTAFTRLQAALSDREHVVLSHTGSRFRYTQGGWIRDTQGERLDNRRYCDPTEDR